MNQGALNLINGEPHYVENGPSQDGGIIFLFATGAKGFFVKFRSQTTSTDEKGNPTITGVKEIDETSEAVRRAIMPPFPRRSRSMSARRRDSQTSAKHKAKANRQPHVTRLPSRAASAAADSNPPATPNPQGYVFADFDPDDLVRASTFRMTTLIPTKPPSCKDQGNGDKRAVPCQSAAHLSAHGSGDGRRLRACRLCQRRNRLKHRVRFRRRQRRPVPEAARPRKSK